MIRLDWLASVGCWQFEWHSVLIDWTVNYSKYKERAPYTLFIILTSFYGLNKSVYREILTAIVALIPLLSSVSVCPLFWHILIWSADKLKRMVISVGDFLTNNKINYDKCRILSCQLTVIIESFFRWIYAETESRRCQMTLLLEVCFWIASKNTHCLICCS